MKIVLRNAIEVRERQRTDIAAKPLFDLKTSILERGLLHPPVCWWDVEAQRWVLTVGGRRLHAIDAIAKDALKFHCDGNVIEPGQVPITTLADFLDEVGRFEAELDENLHREDLSWQDRTKALAALHQMRKQFVPTQTASDTGRELTAGGPVFGVKNPARVAQNVREAALVARHLDDPNIAKARSSAEAYSLVLRKQEQAVNAEIARRVQATPTSAAVSVRHADALEEMPRLDKELFDLILTDPPYGIEATGAGFRARSQHHHNYKDDFETARNILRAILSEGFRTTKLRANLFIFTDIDHFEWLRTQAKALGWVPFRTPMIWQKSQTEGTAPWGGAGPRRTYDLLFYATKGDRGLVSSPVDILTVPRVARSERQHAAEKPIGLLRQLISCSTLPGDMVFDPCCGSGSTLVAAQELGRKGLGFEIDETYYNLALTNLFSEASK